MCKRGDIYFADLGETNGGSEQGGVRPVLIVSNDTANCHSPVITVVPMTGRIKKVHQPTHVVVFPDQCSGLSKPSMVLAEQVISIDKARLKNYRGRIASRKIMREVTEALQVQIGAAGAW